MRELAEIAATGVGHAEFVSKYVNEPAWSEPLYMLAEFIGRHTEDEPLPNGIAMGKELIDMALPIDAVFAAELARLCGADVWAAVRRTVDARLRQLYQSQSSMGRESGLAAMLASGFDDFKDVIVPLLSSQDDSVRLDTYRAWHPFRIGSLGTDWKHTVRQWNEKARANFASESIRDLPLRAETISLSLADPSARVQQSVISAFGWVMSPEEVAQFCETLNDDLFASLIEYLPMRFLPPSIRSRAAATCTRIAETTTDANRRLAALSEAARLGKGDAIDKLKMELSGMNAEQAGELGNSEPRPLSAHSSFAARIGAMHTAQHHRPIQQVELCIRSKSPLPFSIHTRANVPPRDSVSSPGVTRCSSVPCRPQSPWLMGG